MSENQDFEVETAVVEETVSEAETPATWHDTAKALRFALIARITARVVLALVVVGFVFVTYDIVKNASMAAAMGQSIWRNLLGQYLAFVSLIMAVVVMEGVAHFLEIMVDIEENTRK